MEVLIVLATGALCIACFFIGAKVGQTVARGEEIETPSLNPLTAIREHDERKRQEFEQNRQQDRLDTILRNIEAYDGTDRGQEDVPRG